MGSLPSARCVRLQRDPHRILRTAPHMVFFGRPPTLPFDTVLGTLERTDPRRTDNAFLQRLHECTQFMAEQVRDSQADAFLKQKARYDKAHAKPDFSVGETVVLRTPDTHKLGKLDALFKGPYIVDKILSPLTVQLRHLNNPNDIQIAHVQRVKRFFSDGSENFIDNPDSDTFEVERIVDEKTINGRRSYKIRWSGYTPSNDQWLFEEDVPSAVLDLWQAGRAPASKSVSPPVPPPVAESPPAPLAASLPAPSKAVDVQVPLVPSATDDTDPPPLLRRQQPSQTEKPSAIPQPDITSEAPTQDPVQTSRPKRNAKSTRNASFAYSVSSQTRASKEGE